MKGRLKYGTGRGGQVLSAAAAVCCLLLSGCDGLDVLPYARELEGMALMRTLGVDAAEDGTAVTASTGVQNQEKGDAPAVLAERTAGSISAAVLGMQAEGASYVYFGHVGQLLLGEELARKSAAEALEYVLRDVEMRLDTHLYIVSGGRAGDVIRLAAEEGSASSRLEAMAEDPGLASRSMTRTVGEVLSGLEGRGASFAPALTWEEGLQPDGYAILKDGALAGWARGEAAYGVNLLLGQMDADVVEVSLEDGEKAALRVVGAASRIKPVFRGGELTGLEVLCRVDANLAEGRVNLRDPELRTALEQALIQTEAGRIREALILGQALNADFLDLQSAAGMSAPWHWARLQDQWDKWPELDLSVEVQAGLERSYDAE